VDCRVLEDGKLPYQLPHVILHSPTGFNCGYLGSGPADLALSILTHYFKEVPQPESWPLKLEREEGSASKFYQQFKRDIIGSIILDSNESYDLRDEQIGHWLEEGL
jgi:hypothetical protein